MSSCSRCSSSALSPNNRSKAERDRIKAALEKVSRDARERRIRSSPCARVKAKLSEETKLEESKEPQSPGLSDITNYTSSEIQSKEDLKNRQYCEQITTIRKEIDPQREWELAPLKEALKLFCQSDEIFERPRTLFQPPPASIHIGSTISTTQQQTLNIHNLNTHSILPLLQQRAKEKRKVGVQTQTDKRDSDIQCQSLDMSSNSNNQSEEAKEAPFRAVGDKHYTESFPTYGESLATTSKCHDSHHLNLPSELDEAKVADNDISSEFPSQYNESFPSYNSKSFELSKQDIDSDKYIGSMTTSEISKQSVQFKKGCAWVIDINGACEKKDKVINKQPKRRHGPMINQTNEDASTISEDEYDSSFVSDD